MTGPHPRISTQGIGWYNQTASMGAGPSTILGAMAFDPLLGSLGGDMVYFGGCLLPPSPCASNVTWIYNGVAWSPATPTLLPPDLYGAGMDFDPSLSGVVLFGGYIPGSGTSNQTWLYTSTGWSNLSGTAWGHNAPPSAFGTVAWDPAEKGLLLVDGCNARGGCTSYADGTWLMNSTGWHRLGNGPGSPVAIAMSTMAWDRTDRVMVLFGGNDSGRRLLNETWLFNGTAWSNATHIVPGCILNCVYPSARQSSVMTWDAQLGSVMLFGGTNTTTHLLDDDTWTFTRSGGWSPFGALVGLSGPTPNTLGAMAVNSSVAAPLLVSGQCAQFPLGSCLGTDWTLDNPAVLSPSVGPLPSDAGVAVTARSNVSVATGSGPWASWLLTFGDGGFANGHAIRLAPSAGWNFSQTHTYGAGGTYNLSYSVSDFFQVAVQVTASATIDPSLQLNATASPTGGVAGFPVSFVMNASGGTPPYHYLWTFGDGRVALFSSGSHTYSSGGTYLVNATVTDDGGGVATETISLSVSPALIGTIHVQFDPIDAGVPDLFNGTASGGTGGPYTYTWMFGDGAIGVGSATSHAFVHPGTPLVRLNVTDSQGYVNSTAQPVSVGPALTASANASISVATPGESIQFSTTPSGGTPPYSFAWRFGDGTGNRSGSPSHAYPNPGAYTVFVWINDTGGGSVRQQLGISVSSPSELPHGPAPASTPWSNPWVWAGLITAAVVVGILLSWRLGRRGGPKPGAPGLGKTSPPRAPPTDFDASTSAGGSPSKPG